MTAVEMLKSSSRSPPVPQTSIIGPGSRAGSRPGSTARASSARTKRGDLAGGFAAVAQRAQEAGFRRVVHFGRGELRDGALDLRGGELGAGLNVFGQVLHRR